MDGGAVVSIKTNPRRLAVKQRQTLKSLGYDDREIELFALIFKTSDEPADDPRFTCADEADQAR